MKYSLASITSLASFASVATAFVVQNSSPVGTFRSSVVLEASRRAQKVASRTKWAEKRGIEGTAVIAPVDSGLMKNDEGLDFIRLVSDSGSSAEIYLYGGVVTSFKDAEGTEFIAVRPDAKMDGSKPISGGLSHCWPQVSNGVVNSIGYCYLLCY